MNVVLVSTGNFQEYILDNIKQLVRLKHKNIYVITNGEFFDKFSNVNEFIQLIDVSTLEDSFQYSKHSKMDTRFRNGFWMLSSSRFFYLHAFMEKYQVENVIHLENDCPIYYHCDTLTPLLDLSKIYVPMDSYNLSIASILYIPNASLWCKVLDKYDMKKNDMENLSLLSKEFAGDFSFFPICFPRVSDSAEQTFVTKE